MRALIPPLLVALLGSDAAAQEARRNLACEAEDGARFEVMLWTPGAFEVPLHCVVGLDLPVAPCAPDGGWGLSRPGAAAAVERIATGARGLSHDGGWFFADVGPSRFVASASVGSRPPLALEVGGGTVWRMVLDLASLDGIMVTPEAERAFACEE